MHIELRRVTGENVSNNLYHMFENFFFLQQNSFVSSTKPLDLNFTVYTQPQPIMAVPGGALTKFQLSRVTSAYISDSIACCEVGSLLK